MARPDRRRPVVAQGRDWYVSPDGDDGWSGRSPSTPFKTLARAAAAPLVPGDRLRLARGGLWREELTGLPKGVQVRDYGNGAKPCIDGSDVAETWEKTDGLTNVWQASWVHDFGPDGGKCAHRAWRDGIRMRRVTDQAACDATPGSFWADTPTAGGPDLIYVHGDPTGHAMELTRRRWALQLYEIPEQAAVSDLHLRRNAHADGSLVTDGSAARCLAEDGRVHNAFIRGVAEDCVAWKIEPPDGFGGATMFVSFSDTDQERVLYRGCQALAETDALSPTGNDNPHATVGFFGHCIESFGTAVYENCEAYGMVQGFAFNQVQHASYTDCQSDARLSIGAFPAQSLVVTGGTYLSAHPLDSRLLGYDNDFQVPQQMTVRGVRYAASGGAVFPIWVNIAGAGIDVSYCTFVASGAHWLQAGNFSVHHCVFAGENFVFRVNNDAGYDSDYNLYYELKPPPLNMMAFQTNPPLVNITGLPDWRAESGQDLHSMDSNPMFLGNPFLGEFQLSPDSPAHVLRAGADYA